MTVDRAKFTAYSMDPGNIRNRGKWKAWGQLGYDVHDHREAAADDVIGQVARQLPDTPAEEGAHTQWGQKFHASFLVIGPNGRRGTLETTWQIDHGSDTPRMVTNYVKVHKEGPA